MSASIAGHDVLQLELRRPRLGAWQIDADLDTSENLSGSVEVVIDGSVWVGKVLESHVYAGHCHVWIVCGAGGLQTAIEPRQYVKAKLGDVCRDILGLGSETISTSTSSAVLGRTIDQWERLKGPLAHAIVLLLDRKGLAWRGLQDGTYWIGEDQWSEITPGVIVLNEDWSTGSIFLAPETDFNDLAGIAPGSKYNGHSIDQVVHRYSSNSLITELKTSSLHTELDRFLEPVRREIDYSTAWECVVKGQNADGTLQVSPEDPRLQGAGLDKVPILTGIPGFECKVTKGATVTVVFDGRDPSKPRAVLWKSGDENVTNVSFKPGGSGAPAAKVGDELEITFPMGLILSTPIGPSVMTVATPARAIITGPGNGKFLL